MKKRPAKALTGPAWNDSYLSLLADIKERVSQAQVRAHLAVSRELILLYWSIGRDIVARQKTEGWGKAVIEKLAADIQSAFPGFGGVLSKQHLAHAGLLSFLCGEGRTSCTASARNQSAETCATCARITLLR